MKTQFMPIRFVTPRLLVEEFSNALASSPEQDSLLIKIPSILTAKVVKYLPPYFHHVDTQSDAKTWLEKMVKDSRLFLVKELETQRLIGFLFAYQEDREAHIGYLLHEAFWGLGLAEELVQEFVNQAAEQDIWDTLVAGVDSENPASSKLLTKLGFYKSEQEDTQVDFYHMDIKTKFR